MLCLYVDEKRFIFNHQYVSALTVGLTIREQEEREAEENKKKNATADSNCCTCPMSEKQRRVVEREKILDIHFQDYLQNQVYIKR